MLDIQEFSNRKFILISIAWWVFWTVMQAYVLMDLGFKCEITIIDSLITNISFALAGYVVGMLVRYYLPSKKNRYYLFISGFALAALSVSIQKEAITYVFPAEIEYLLFLDKTTLIRFSFALMMVEFRVLISWLFYYMKAQQENNARKKDTEDMVREAELSKLRLQLQPHFLFNSLNSISALAGSRPEEARKMIQQLSDFLRGTLKKDDQQLVSLKEELGHLNLYLEIEKVRFGHRLSTNIERNEQADKLLLPPLLLQPIVENAIKFGLYDTIGDITIRIEAGLENKMLVIMIHNPFDPATTNPKAGTGFGLNSIERRLYLLYARHDLLSISQQENIFTTTVKIPQAHD